MSDDLLTALSNELAKLFEPLVLVVENPLLLDQLLLNIGASSETAGGDALVNALAEIVALGRQLDELSSQPSPSFSGIAAVLKASADAFHGLRDLGKAGGPAHAIEGFGSDLVGFLVAAYLLRWHPLAREVAGLLTLVDPRETQDLQPAVTDGENLVRLPYRIDRFHLDRLSKLLSDPSGTLRTAYANDLLTVADANAMADRLFPRFLALLRVLGVTCQYGFNPGDEPLFGDAAPHGENLRPWICLIVLPDGPGVSLVPSPSGPAILTISLSPATELPDLTQVDAWAHAQIAGTNLSAAA